MSLELILMILLGLSETIALIPSLKSNSVLQIILEMLKKVNKK